MHKIRWVLLAPAVIGAWILVFALGLLAPVYIEHTFCPPEDVVQMDSCGNESVQQAMNVAFLVGVTLSVVVAVIVAATLAPSHKRVTTWITLTLTMVPLGLFANAQNESWLVFSPAAIGGTICAAALMRIIRDTGT